MRHGRSSDAIDRRSFLAAAGSAAGAAMLAPAILAQDKSGLAEPIVGSGAHSYRCRHDWAALPPGHAFGNTHGVAVDAAGNVYIKHTVHASAAHDEAICVFDPTGRFVRAFGAEYKGGAHGLLLAREPDGEFLYLADCQRGVVAKTDLLGNEVYRLRCPLDSGLYGGQQEYKPTNVAMVPHPAPGEAAHPLAGHFFVADGYGKSWIHRYDPQGTYLGSFGGPGKERGQVLCPHGIFIDPRHGEPRIVVADRSNRRLQYFSLDGRHQGFVTDELRAPCHFDTRGSLLLVPDLEARVTLLDADDTLVVHLGDGENYALRDKPREQFVPGKFIAPHSACFDAHDDIFVVEWVEVGRVTKLERIA
ncbi:MAG: twin-arginine translocation signal domain-containing protein [Phycisphaerales bacterium]|nr:twin-arginine translocation signal domain-containing protein [Phycisphaerales bacterium]